MFYSQRHEEIIRLLKEHNMISVHSLAKQLHVSEPTIRRDLTILEKDARVKRTFGGAAINDMNTSEIPLFLRESESRKPKETIAKKAVENICDGMVIFIDASSTASKIIKYLCNYTDLTVITNSPKNSLSLAELRIKSYSTGGLLLGSSIAYVGRPAEKFIRNFNADLLFFSCRGLTMDGVLTDSSIEESELRQVMIQQAKKRIFLCTSDKIGKRYLYNLCTVADVDQVICETPLPDGLPPRRS